MLSGGLRARLDALLLCGFRPFFLITAAWGALALAAWLAALGGALALPTVAGGALAWHAHEMVLGFGGAALLGFLLTALPEFTASAAVPRRQVAMLALLHPLGVVLTAIFVAGIFVGSDAMSRAAGVPTYIADMLMATALLFMVLAILLTKVRVVRG